MTKCIRLLVINIRHFGGTFISELVSEIMGDHQYDVIATKIGSTLLPNNLIYSMVKIIMKIISSDIT